MTNMSKNDMDYLVKLRESVNEYRKECMIEYHESDAYINHKTLKRAYYVVGTHILMEKVLTGTYECMSTGNTHFEIRYDENTQKEVNDVLYGNDLPEYLVQAFEPASAENVRNAIKNCTAYTDEDQDRSETYYSFYGEMPGKVLKPCKGKCTHTITTDFNTWCMRCRLVQQIPARLMKKIRSVDRDYLKIFNPVKGDIKVRFSNDGIFPVIHISMSPKGYNPTLARSIVAVSDYLDTLSVQDISVKLHDRHIAYIKEQQRLAIESLEDQKTK